MYPYETPFGIIMKINRNPIATLPDDVFKRDHAFWSKYSERLIGNWITYDTSVQQIADWVEKIYLRNDYSGFTGDRKFVRDDDAQKAFSKLRSSQAGMYAWRLHLLRPSPPYPPPDPQYLPYRPKSDAEVQQLYTRVRLRLQTIVCVLSLQPGSGHPVCQLPLSVPAF